MFMDAVGVLANEAHQQHFDSVFKAKFSRTKVAFLYVSWILSMEPNIHRNVDGEVAYAANQ